jgi:hypothetical protein
MTGSWPVHTPAWQVSVWLHASPSSQGVPSGRERSEQMPVPGLHTLGWWHGSATGHITGAPPVHTPATHASPVVQASPSSQAAPSGFAGLEQPVDALHVPAVWHGSSAAHTTAEPPPHTPAWHVSPCVQASPSSQAVPFGSGTLEQTPVAGLHTLGFWHGSGAGHTTGLDPTHTPSWQVSVCVQASPSSQALPVQGVHVPSDAAPAAIEHAPHTPAPQAVSQQTPSMQKPLAQSAAPEHAEPSGPEPPSSSALAVPAPSLPRLPPPATITAPDDASRTAPWLARAVPSEAIVDQVSVDGV